MTSTVPGFILWKNTLGNDVYVDLHSSKSLNDVIRHTKNTYYHPSTITGVSSFETGFIALLNIHNMYIHSSNLGHCNSIGVRGENTIIKQVSVSSSFGYLVVDSVVAPHDKLDVGRQLINSILVLRMYIEM